MKVTYYDKEDILRVQFNSSVIESSETLHAGLVIDFNQHGRIVALELSPATEFLGTSNSEKFLECTIISGDSAYVSTQQEISAINFTPRSCPSD